MHGCSTTLIVLTEWRRVTGECGRLSGAAISATLVLRTRALRALRYPAERLQNECYVAEASMHAGGY